VLLCVGKDELQMVSLSYEEELIAMREYLEAKNEQIDILTYLLEEQLQKQDNSKVTHHSHSSCDNSSNNCET